jgi:1-acyl-sn-glycerol-3-phosphate acyltransferase
MMHWVLAAIFIGVLLIALGIAIERDRRFRQFSWPQYALFATAWLIVRVWWRASLPRDIPLRRGEGAVIVCNHRSSVDPFFFQVCIPWVTHWMVAKEYCEHPTFAWFLRLCEVIPTNRGGIDTASTKTAIRWASSGGVVGMLPEGRIGQVWTPFFMPARVKLHWGKPMDLSDKYDRATEDGVAQEITLQALREIAKLAGRDDFEPKLAGRRWKTDSVETPTTE